MFHYGDYIYEFAVLRPGERDLPGCASCPATGECTLDEYRHRYAHVQDRPRPAGGARARRPSS